MLSRARPLAARLLQAGTVKTTSRLSAAQIRQIQSSQSTKTQQLPTVTSETSTVDSGGVKREDVAGHAFPSHEPDYGAEVDYRTS
jgi:hypothetical protein